MPQILLILMIAVVASGMVAGCGGKVCPPGTVRVGDFCKRVDPDSGVDPDVIITNDLPSDTRDAVGDNDHPDVVNPPDEKTDTPSDSVDEPSDTLPPEDVGDISQYPAGYIGKACNAPRDCKSTGWPDGMCLSWPRGFCTLPGCESGTECPARTVCMSLAAGGTGAVCTLECTTDADCRDTVDTFGNGYSCKVIPDPNGVFKSICFMERAEPMHVGGPCQAHEDCADGMGCLPNFDGGYCAVLSCDQETDCPAGTLCTRLQGRGVCMKSCQSGEDCAETRECRTGEPDCTSPVQLSRGCIEMKNAITLDKIKVCGSGTAGKSVGEQCLNETECKSGKCNVSYTGLCSDFEVTGRRCTLDSDCAITKAFCRPSSEETYGFCSGNCSRTTNNCTEQSMCVETLVDGALTAMCVPSCSPSNPEDPFSESDCWEEAGLRCMWGDSLFQPSVRSCVRIDPGDVGTSCRRDDDCFSGSCVGQTETEEGTCTMACLSEDRCPFPTVCQVTGGNKLCMKRCAATPDCPGEMICKSSTSGDFCEVPAR